MHEQLWAMVSFHGLIFLLLAADLGVFNRKAHEIGFREAILASVVWIACAALFCGYIALTQGVPKALLFATAYVVEKSLSVDNIFIFVVIFTAFGVPKEARHRLLFWGVLGAIALRAPLIYGGVKLIHHFRHLIYVFGAFIIWTGIKLLFAGEDEDKDPNKSWFARLVCRMIPTTAGYHGARLFVREGGKFLATPLFTTLLVVELSDVMFALDSIPAVIAVTDDFFIAYTSNIFAILGLRALFFLVSSSIERFHYLEPALSFILVFVGGKMIVGEFSPSLKISPGVSLLVILGALVVAVFASLRVHRHMSREETDGAESGKSEIPVAEKDEGAPKAPS